MRKIPLEKNYFYIVYSADFAALPVAYCDNLQELANFFNKSKLQITNLYARYRNDPRYKNGAMKAPDGKKYRIAKWHINGTKIEPAYSLGGIL